MRKGQHLSEVAKAKISIKLLGKRFCMASEFKKGQVSWNKGKKGTHFSPKTEFKKGNISANYRGGYKVCKDGIYIITKNKKYYYNRDGKKVIARKYEQLARIKYREAFGDFPKDMVILHKDGDILNNQIDNLELISRGELLRRNQKIKKNCKICGLPFIAVGGNNITCSKDCYKENCKIANRIWVKNHRGHLNEVNRKYREKNREKIRENSRIYREKQRLLVNTNSNTTSPQSLNTHIY